MDGASRKEEDQLHLIRKEKLCVGHLHNSLHIPSQTSTVINGYQHQDSAKCPREYVIWTSFPSCESQLGLNFRVVLRM
jgi:hypothetical protein